MSPVRAFFLLGAVAAIVPLTILATRPEAAPTTAPEATRGPDFSLTDAEAIAEFERLNDMRIKAYKARDVSLLIEALATDSPLLTRGTQEIERLLLDAVLIQSRFVSENVEIVRNTSEEILVRQTEIEHPRVVTEGGRDVTAESSSQRRVIEWTLSHEEDYQWKLYDSRLISHGAVNE